MKEMLAVDEHHWWYRGRRRIIRAELERLPLPRPARVLDAGCGSGRTLQELVRYGEVTGIELNEEAAELARSRGLGEVRVGRLEELPWPDQSFDLITCLDVIEHTPDDRPALAELHRVCRPGGWLLVTVPAYPALWSLHDEANHHYRRYSRAVAARRRDGHRLDRAPAELVQQPAARARGGGPAGPAALRHPQRLQQRSGDRAGVAQRRARAAAGAGGEVAGRGAHARRSACR